MGARGIARRAIVLAAAVAAIGAGVASSPLSAGATNPVANSRPRCTPGYKPCIPNRRSDVDCYGGGGNGPRYTKPGVVYRVWGSDRYRLDADHDGWGCE